MKAIIMAGGQGSRLRPLTCDRPKPMVPVANRPIMEYAVELLKKHDIRKIGSTLQYLPEKIKDYFGDGSSYGVEMEYFIEEVPLGTAGSVKNAANFLDETFIVVSGDALTDFNLQEAIDKHKRKGAIATLVLTEVSLPLEYGVVITDEEGRVKRFLEKPSWGEVFSDWVNTGIYILEPEALEYFDFGEKYDFSKDLFPKLLKNREPVFGCLLSGYWCDIGNLDQYIQAHKDLLQGRVNINSKGLLITDKYEIDSQSLGFRAYPPVIIGENCHFEKDVKIGPYTVIGDNVTIDREASLKRSVVWSNCHIGKSSEIRGAVIGSGSIIKTGVTILEASVVGDNSIIEDHSVIKPDVKLWPEKIVDSGAVVKESLIWGDGQRRDLFGIEGIPGLVNRDLTPELGSKIGAAFASTIERGGNVIVSSDGFQSTEMMKHALTAGLISCGVNANDIGSVTTPSHRLAVTGLNALGGVHIKSDNENPEKCWMQFSDEDGKNITRDKERKIESIYSIEEFRRVREGLGKTRLMTNFLQYYIGHIMAKCDSKKMPYEETSIAVYANGPVVGEIIEMVKNRLNINLLRLEKQDIMVENENPEVFLSKYVLKNRLFFGAFLDNNGERIILIDNKGRVVDEQAFTALAALVIMKVNKGGNIIVPVNSSHVIEEVAQRYGGNVIRTKTAPWAVMERLLAEEKRGDQGYSQFFFQNDGVYAFLKILEYLINNNIELASLVEEIPHIYFKVVSTECPWKEKGRVMRSLIEEERDGNIELLDGIKVKYDKGWALVLPHAEKPLYNIYSEGRDFETAEELSRMYVDKINNILSNG